MSGTYTDVMLKSYNEQVRGVFIPKNVQNPEDFEVKLQKAVGDTNGAQLLYVDGGLFADACLERPVMNLMLNPQRSLANRIPVRRSNLQKATYGYITDIGEPTGALPDAVCEDGQEVGDLSACYSFMEKGRMSFSTKTIEMESIIEKLCRGVQDDLYLVGDVRGVSGPVPNGFVDNTSVVAQGAVRRQIQLVGRALQRETLRQFWSGDPSNGSLNTAGGGAKQFYGLSFLIADDYGTGSKPFATGTNCNKLNSVIMDFGNSNVGEAAANGYGLFYHMEEMESRIWNRAAFMGHVNIEMSVVMHPVMWDQVTRYLPCEVMAGNCGIASGDGAVPSNVPTVISVNDMAQVALRQQMQNTMSIQLNGRTYNVILDDALPVTTNAGPPVTYTSDIYFVPTRVDNVPVLFWDALDYRVLSQELSPIPGGLGGLHGWIDGGIKLLNVQHNNSCFKIDAKMKLALQLLAPHLAGKIENVDVAPLTGPELSF
jgi:hypothetical protein